MNNLKSRMVEHGNLHAESADILNEALEEIKNLEERLRSLAVGYGEMKRQRHLVDL